MDGGRPRIAALVSARPKRMNRQALFDGLSDAILIANAALRIGLINDRARVLLGLSTDFPVRGRTLRQVLRAATLLPLSAAEEVFAACLARTDAAVPARATVQVAGLRVTLDPIAGGHWRITLASSAPPVPSCDALTGLADRAAFQGRLQQLIARAEDNGEGTAGPCVLMLDLDRFKQVNDTVGHPVGDALLKAVAERLRGGTRTADMVARLGGDEFAILLPTDTTVEVATQLAARLTDLVGRPYLVAGHLASVGASIGIAFCSRDAPDADTLVRNADLALYQAKRDGRGRWCVFAPHMHERAQARQVLEADLRRALALHQFALYYQPQFSLRSRRLTGFEALLRWPHPTRGMIPPLEFIPLAEEIGLIGPLGEWVLHTACADAVRWPAGLRVAVNVSPLQFENSEMLLAAVREALEHSGLPADRLEIEVTESALLGAEQATLATLHVLRRLGVRVAMDDFGTGYSSLSQLRSFPFDKIKIDRSFVRDLAHDSQSAAIVRSINELGASLGMATIAEGVETDEQAESLLQGGCADIQGYLISRPIPAEAVGPLIDHLSNARTEIPT